MEIYKRLPIALLTLSAAAFIGIASHEGYTDKAIIPTKGDKPTLGYGSTFHEDGSTVKMGETTNPVNALKKAQAHISKEEVLFRNSLPNVYMNQAEYDVWIGFVYQFGTGNWMKSSMRRELLAANPVAACNALLKYRFSAGFDCSTPGNKICMGVWTRQLERQKNCLNAGGY